MGPGLLQPLFSGFSSWSSGLIRTTKTPWILETPEEKSKGVQSYVYKYIFLNIF